PERFALAPGCQEVGDHAVLKELPGLGVPEESRDVDQEIVEQLRDLTLVDLEVIPVGREVRRTDGVHPLADAPAQARFLVAGEIEAAGLLDVVEELLQPLDGLRLVHPATSRATIDRSTEDMSSIEATTSTSPVSIAADGIPKNPADAWS